jgi:DNA topoisomerase-3
MKVCIAEKPSVAQSIAQILGANQGGPRQGYWEGNGYQVTWTFGHLCELKNPDEYDPKWKAWSIVWLPIIPQKFGITLKDDDGVKKQFEIIQKLYENAECIINCGDAGQEGELIQRWVMQKAGAIEREKDGKIPIYRLWINSMTDEAIREGFQHLELQVKYDRLYMAGLSRAIGDWLLGMNATRLYTLRYGQTGQRQVISIGRVQTPTLAMIVKRHFEIVNFQPQQYWELKTVYREVTFNSTKGRYDKVEEAQAALEAIKDSLFTIKDVQKKSGKESPKRLYDLTSLQVDCNRKFGFSAEQTLQLIQSLYEKKVATYPRVDTTYLPDDVYPKCPNILKGLRGYEMYTGKLLEGGKKLPKSKNFFDNSKVTDHHAIIPTGVPATNISATERQVYDLIARRFISAFYSDCKFNTTTVLGEASKVEFKATGKLIIDPGWRIVYDGQKDDDDDMDGGSILPDFVVGESGPHTPSLLEKWTQPPKPYTEATLLRAMETAGKQCEDEELRDAMKENGIGRPSTRAAIIETLFKRRYIRKEKKNLIATQTGIDVIQVIHEELLKSPELTGQWEKKLRMIERGEYQAGQFIDELKQMVVDIIHSVMSDQTNRMVAYVDAEEEKKKAAAEKKAAAAEKRASQPRKPRKPKLKVPDKCPLCGGAVLKGKTAYGCANWRTGCTWRLPFDASNS